MGPKHFGNSLKSYFFWCKPHWMKATTYTGRKQQFQQALLKTTFKCFFIWFLQCLKQCIVSTSFCNVAACVNLIVKDFRKFYCALTLLLWKQVFVSLLISFFSLDLSPFLDNAFNSMTRAISRAKYRKSRNVCETK